MVDFCDLPIDKQANLFYGLPEQFYDAGFSIDWDSITFDNDKMTFTYRLLFNGQPYHVGAVRMEGKRIPKITVEA